ncbi:MAG: SPFH domain-containing protein, partial [Candidatus Thorarchaeota archaeon]
MRSFATKTRTRVKKKWPIKRGRPYFHSKNVRHIAPVQHQERRKQRPINYMQKRGIATEVMLGMGAVGVYGVLSGLRIVRPNQKGLVEVFGKYTRTTDPGLRLIWPFGIGKMTKMPTDMHKVDIPEQSIITKEQLNADVDAVAYYRVDDPYKARYNVDDYADTVPRLAQTTLRNVLGTFTLAEANSQRQMINEQLKKELDSQITEWGMVVISVELQEIRPTRRVQESMNNII